MIALIDQEEAQWFWINYATKVEAFLNSWCTDCLTSKNHSPSLEVFNVEWIICRLMGLEPTASCFTVGTWTNFSIYFSFSLIWFCFEELNVKKGYFCCCRFTSMLENMKLSGLTTTDIIGLELVTVVNIAVTGYFLKNCSEFVSLNFLINNQTPRFLVPTIQALQLHFISKRLFTIRPFLLIRVDTLQF